MADFRTHATVGILVGGGIAIHDSYRTTKKLQFGLLIAGVAGGFIGGVFPDALEPATNPHHRKFFHAMLPSAIMVLKSDFTGIEDPHVKIFLKALLWGYVGHLILDLGTPKGLPVA